MKKESKKIIKKSKKSKKFEMYSYSLPLLGGDDGDIDTYQGIVRVVKNSY